MPMKTYTNMLQQDGVSETVSAGGNVARAIQGIIADLFSTPMEMISALTGGISKSEEDMARLAATRRAIFSDELTQIGSSLEKLDSEFQSLIKHSCKLNPSLKRQKIQD